MPQTESKNSSSLGIRLERGQPNFTLPDTITGHVYCSTHLVTSKAIVTIALVGRSKSKLIVRHGSWGRTYRGRFALINEPEHTHKLFEAPLHIPADGDEKIWPFVITLPSHFDATRTAPETPQDKSYLSLTPDQPATYSLPPSFAVQNWGYGEGMECFVEYFLRAELTTVTRGSTDTKQAIQVLTITTLRHDRMIENSCWRVSQHPYSLEGGDFVAERNISQFSNASMREPRSERGQSSLDFKIVLKTPSLLRLGQSESISLLLLAEPASPLLPDSMLLTSHEVSLTEISLTLVATTNIKCRGRRKARHDNAETKFRLSTKETNKNLLPIVIPWKDERYSTSNGADDAYDTSQALNAGDRLSLRLPEEGVCECFTTYNIQHAHRLEWKMAFEIAGKISFFSGAEPVNIIAPSGDDMPMDYERSQSETMERTQSVDARTGPPEYTHERPLPPRVPRQPGGAFGLSRLWEGV